MKKWLLFFFFGVLILQFYGCYPEYGIANSGGEPIYFTKPVYEDSAMTANYIGGKYSHTLGSAYSNKNEYSYFGKLYVYRSYTQRYFNFSYGVFGYMGSYKVDKVEEYRGFKSFYGGGVSSEINLNIPFSIGNIRPIGFRGTLLYEDGDFASFRRKASSDSLANNLSASNFTYNMSFTDEVVFKIKENSFGFYGAFGLTFYNHDDNSYITVTGGVHYSYKRFSIYFHRTSCFLGIGESFSLGLNYRFK